MELSELTAYAAEKFQIAEQRKWADFPGFSVLADPETGKWLALLMRQWDSDTGTEIQKCDIKCGRQNLSAGSEPYLSQPFRMKGEKWVGINFDRRTKPEVVFRLFDRAVYQGRQQAFTIVLEERPRPDTGPYQDIVLPPPPAAFRFPRPEEKIPGKIREMQKLYEYSDGSFAQKCRNFYRQGKFMEDYEDDLPWSGDCRRYFTTYHDLTVRQLRGYFAWRANVRRGTFSPIPSSLAYLYLYELLNGIGTASPEDGLRKMQAFKAGFLDSGLGDPAIGKNLRRWMLDYAVLHHIPASLARTYADPAIIERDAALAALKSPQAHTDAEIFSALCTFAGPKLRQSPVVKKEAAKGERLFASVWRKASASYAQDGKDIFTACFGERKSFPWRPLANAVYWEETPPADADYELDECRLYRCRDGVWQEERYDSLYFDREKLRALVHEADRGLRRYLKTGHYPHENPSEAWASPYAQAAAAEGRQAEIEAARPKISIDLSALDQIRQDSRITRDSLLIGEETDPPVEEPAPPNVSAPAAPQAAGGAFPGLPDPYLQILSALLRGESAETYISAGRLMPSVVADAINEAFFDEIGDNILACDGNTITLVEDYREDAAQILGGIIEE